MKAPGFGMSFLDVLFSALGATVVLAVIFSIIKIPVSAPSRVEHLLVHVVATVESPGDAEVLATPLLGVKFEAPSGEVFYTSQEVSVSAAESVDAWGGSHAPEASNGLMKVELWVRVKGGQTGAWLITPYLAWHGYPAVTNATLVSVEAWGPRGTEKKESEDAAGLELSKLPASPALSILIKG